MHMSELLKRELDSHRERTGKTSLSTLETGTIRNEGERYQINDGWSTLTFAEYAKETDGSHTGIDLSIVAATNVLLKHNLLNGVKLIEGYSVDVLGEMLVGAELQFDVILLDSDNDPNLILHEYMLARHMLAPGGLLLVDDVDLESTGVVKGHAIAPWLARHGLTYRIEERTGDGYRTGVLVVES